MRDIIANLACEMSCYFIQHVNAEVKSFPTKYTVLYQPQQYRHIGTFLRFRDAVPSRSETWVRGSKTKSSPVSEDLAFLKGFLGWQSDRCASFRANGIIRLHWFLHWLVQTGKSSGLK